MEQVEKELDRLWRRMNNLEREMDERMGEVRDDIAELHTAMSAGFGSTISTVKAHGNPGVNWLSVIATILAASAGIGVPVAVAFIAAS